MVSCALLCACSQQKTYRIGISQCSTDDWRAKMNEEIEREILLHPEAEVEIRSADDSNEKQIADIRYFKDNGFDIIIAAPNEAEAITPVIKEVYESGTPIVLFDRDINGDTYTAWQGADNEQIGRSAARYARHLGGEQFNVLEIYGLKGSTPAVGRHNGFVQGLDSIQGANLVSTVYGNWNLEKARDLTAGMLKSHPEINIIYAHNDRMAIGAAEAAEAAGRQDIKIIGIDAAPNIGIKAVQDGVIDATFLYPTEGYQLIKTALAILKGEPYEKNLMLPSSSAVDKSNADILLVQNETLKEETSKIKTLKGQMDAYWEAHNAQQNLFYAMIAILVLLGLTLWLVLRSFWVSRRHRDALKVQNVELEHQRDKQKDLNVQLKSANEQQLTATRSKLRFFTNVSHDLRTPLTLIAEPVEQLAGSRNISEHERILMKIARKNVKILHRLINQILDFRKFENGKLELNLQEVNISAMIREWSGAFAAIARKRDITLKVECQDEVMSAVDVEKAERVFYNIVSNAFRYTPDNGHITIHAGQVGERFIFSVEDDGPGISQEALRNIFERFYRADNVHPQGSGIGLALVKAFVELHGGNVKVESEVGRGSKFIVDVPIRHVDKEYNRAEEATMLDTTEIDDIVAEAAPGEFSEDKPFILVIDDNADIRLMISELLGEDYNILTASNGARGVKLAAKYVPDLVICDVMMPGMDGMEVCRILKGETATSHIPVLMLTACAMDEQKAQGYESGADGYVAKPFNTSLLKARIKALIENRKRVIAVRGEEVRGISKPKTDSKEPTPNSTLPTPNSAKQNLEDEFYQRFLALVEEKISDPELSVDSLAESLGLGRSQFYRKIKALTNYSPVELLRRIRVQRGRELLMTTSLSISEVTYKVGFSAPGYFAKCFKAAFDETPTDFRTRLSQR